MGVLTKVDVLIHQSFSDRLYTYSEGIFMHLTMSQQRNLSILDFVRRSSNATVKTPRSLDSHARPDELQAEKRMCDCRPPLLGYIDHMSWSRFS